MHSGLHSHAKCAGRGGRERRKGGRKKVVDGGRGGKEEGPPRWRELGVFMNRSGWLLQPAVPRHFLPPSRPLPVPARQKKGS